MDGEKTDEELMVVEGENVPEKLPGGGLSGSLAVVSPEEARKRRMVLSRLMASSISDDEIIEMMGTKFLLTRQAVRSMMRDVYSQWAEEDKERSPYQKHAAKRRIRKWLGDASKDGSWTAVANLEKVLSSIEGTQEPIEVSTPANDRLSEAMLAVLGNMDPTKVRKLIDRGKVLYTDGKVEVLGRSND
jgi:hypothetical protein